MATTSKKTPARGSPSKKSAVQGEGDYVSARKYNERTRAFVERTSGGKVPASKAAKATPAELQAAEKQALARSRGKGGDKADAALMKEAVTASRTRRRA